MATEVGWIIPYSQVAFAETINLRPMKNRKKPYFSKQASSEPPSPYIPSPHTDLPHFYLPVNSPKPASPYSYSMSTIINRMYTNVNFSAENMQIALLAKSIR